MTVPKRPAPTTAQAGRSVMGGSSSRTRYRLDTSGYRRIASRILRALFADTRAISAEPGDSVISMAGAEQRREELKAAWQQASTCTRCPQLASTRTTVVFGSGNADADLMFVGEAPGANEDKQGLPFVGQAGRLLEQLLGEIGLTRGDVFIANVLKCRPPGNRDPLPQEIDHCQDYLFRQLELIEPRVVCTLGNFAAKLLRADPGTGITRLHGREEVRRLGPRTVRLYPLFHPAAALYTPSMLATLREDFARIPELLALPVPEQPEPEPEPELVMVAAEPEPEPPPVPDIEQLGLF
jgi:uracil-DNA glycosylase family 4